MKYSLVVAALILAGPSPARAEETVAPASSASMTTAAYPLVMYAPEFSLMMGGGAVMVFRRAGAAAAAKPDNLTVNAMYTLKNQTVLQVLPELYSNDEKYKFRATALYQNMPATFFGIGNSGAMSYSDITAREEKYTNRTFIFQPQLTRTVWGRLRAGLSYDVKDTRVLDVPRAGRLAGGSVQGVQGGLLSGLGGVLDYDGRDNLFYPSRGVYAQAVTRFYRKSLGSDYVYDYYSLDLRGYRRLGEGGVLALQFSGVAAGRGVPFYDMPLYDLRGIYNTYFLNRANYYTQAEYRFPLKHRFYAVVFAGGGNSAPELRKLSLRNIQFIMGSGVRFVLDKKEKINMRFDIGASRWGVQPYFGITEAF